MPKTALTEDFEATELTPEERYHQETMKLMEGVEKRPDLKGKALERYVAREMKKIQSRSYKVHKTSKYEDIATEKRPWQKKFKQSFIDKDVEKA